MALLAIGLYEEHREGASIDALAAGLGVPSEWVAERIEAARLMLDFQIQTTAA